MIKPDSWILKQAERGMIKNFSHSSKQSKTAKNSISYGISSYGYDARLSPNFKISKSPQSTSDRENSYCLDVKDPQSVNELNSHLEEYTGDFCVIPPAGFALATTVEEFHLPKNVMAIVLGKSTYARCGIIVNATPVEPGFKGTVTLELSNTNVVPVKIYAYEGIAQFLFFESDEECLTCYADSKGKYQFQKGVTLPKH